MPYERISSSNYLLEGREHCHSYNYFSPYDILYNNVYIHHL